MKLSFSDYAKGARVATELVNSSPTVRSTGESLTDPDALARFLAEHHVRPDALAHGRAPAEEDLHHVRALRQQVRTVLQSDSDEKVVAAANELVARAATGPALHRDAGHRWQWHVVTSPGAPLADELAALIGTGLLGTVRTLSHDRFRHCAAPTCEGMFVDTSKAGRRRYCTPDLCGNRLNVANHRARRLASTDDHPSTGTNPAP